MIPNQLFIFTLLAQSEPGGGQSWWQEVLDELDKMGNQFTAFIPKFLTAIFLLIVGIIISTLVARGIRFLLEKFGGFLSEKFGNNPLLERSGLSGMFFRANSNARFSLIISKSLFWILILMFFASAARSLGLAQISEPLSGLVSFLPRVMTALIISITGFVIGDLVRGIVINGANKVGLDYANALANLVYAFILVLVMTIAISTLGVDTTLIRHTVEILLLGGSIATALALGLGMRSLAQNIVSGVYTRDLYPVGTTVKITGKEELEGKVVSVGPVTTQLKTSQGNAVNIPNSSLVLEIVESKTIKSSGTEDSSE